MTPQDFQRVAFTPSLRPQLLAALKGDPILRAAAEKRVAKIEQDHQIGMVRDRCHITNMEYQTLTALLAQVAADREPPASIGTL